MRYIYDQFQNYFGHSSWIVKIAAYTLRPYLRTWDYIVNDDIDVMIANSHFIKKRIEIFYNRKAIVINPFVDLKDFKLLQEVPINKTPSFIMVTAFAPNKRVDLAIKTFNLLGKELRIVGSGSSQEEMYLRGMAKPNIKFLGSLSRQEVIKELAQAQALIFPGMEDFGIVPLEALAAGTPVIALGKGGVLDTLDHNSAVFFYEETAEALTEAIKLFYTQSYDRNYLFARAKNFSKEKFQENILKTVNNFKF